MNTKLTVNTLADAFTRQHQDLDTRFRHVLEASQAGNWRECDKEWSPLSDALRDHMAFEERLLFPLYAKSSPTCNEDTSKLCGEHAEIRILLERLGCEIELHHAPPAGVDKFIIALRSHAQREEALFHPWLITSALDVPTQRGVRHWIRTRVARAFAQATSSSA